MCTSLKNHLGHKTHKVLLTQEPKPADHQQRRAFADWFLEMLEYKPEFHHEINLTDGAHFQPDGYENNIK